MGVLLRADFLLPRKDRVWTVSIYETTQVSPNEIGIKTIKEYWRKK